MNRERFEDLWCAERDVVEALALLSSADAVSVLHEVTARIFAHLEADPDDPRFQCGVARFHAGLIERVRALRSGTVERVH